MKKITNSAEFKKYEKEAFLYKLGGTWGLLYRFLVVICKLLDKDESLEPKTLTAKQIKEIKYLAKATKIKREPSVWSKFAGEQMKSGKSLKEAAELWKNKFNPPKS